MIKVGGESGCGGDRGMSLRALARLHPVDERIARALDSEGRALPPSGRAAGIRRELAELAAARASEMVPLRGRARLLARFGSLRLPAGAAAVIKGAVTAILVTAIMFPVGLSSSHAMPGSSLYPVKRALEKAHAFLSPRGEGKANTFLSQAEKRHAELEYSRRKELDGWYFELARDAEGKIEEARRETLGLAEKSAREVKERARELVHEHERIAGEVIPEMRPEQKEAVEEWVDVENEELEEKPRGSRGEKESREPSESEVE